MASVNSQTGAVTLTYDDVGASRGIIVGAAACSANIIAVDYTLGNYQSVSDDTATGAITILVTNIPVHESLVLRLEHLTGHALSFGGSVILSDTADTAVYMLLFTYSKAG